ncbi:hypothetical protein HUT19_28965 [Streptomyces sp. NA02950]|uniref:hypothetical protein n=1 Tax=Streptomyces sp. NA02950 TaxID=2742137 RepID=UPI0015927D0F|nr:hypothetical protein [Streptomyces sp. NA02950]QKV95266.1 hypothetical protein HUT19_28965 [Streptomyces sp. NA02950]
MHTHRKVVGLLAGTLLLGFVGAIPAHAEGSRTTYFTAWRQGHESSRWNDNNRDGVSTSVALSGCSTDGAEGFTKANLKLWKNRDFLPDTDKGTRKNHCGRSAWGDQSSGKYYFELFGFTTGGTMSARKVVIKY